MNNLAIVDTISKLNAVMKQHAGKNVLVSYSGGADSDIVMHLLRENGYDVPAVFYDTGLEYQATHRHVEMMRNLGYQIATVKAAKPIPTVVKEYGYPFVNKGASNNLTRLQSHGFNFQHDGPLDFDTLYAKYPRCKSALRWWTNTHLSPVNCISNNKYLKEFIIEHGLPFLVSDACCDWAKKKPNKIAVKQFKTDLILMGIRKAEGGRRSIAYKSCFVPPKKYSYSMYFPLFWWNQSDREVYEQTYNVQHSACYSEYGLKRTGCVGCPFNRHYEEELAIVNQHEPKFYRAVNTIFGPSYALMREYRQFADEHGKKDRCDKLTAKSQESGQLAMFPNNAAWTVSDIWRDDDHWPLTTESAP